MSKLNIPFLTILAGALGAFLAANPATPDTVRITGFASMTLAVLNHVIQTHMTARNADSAAASLGRTPPSTVPPLTIAEAVAQAQQLIAAGTLDSQSPQG